MQGHVKKDSLGIDLNDLVAAVHMHSDRRGNAEDDSEQLEILFNRIDTSQDGYVSWEEFASYVAMHSIVVLCKPTRPLACASMAGVALVGLDGSRFERHTLAALSSTLPSSIAYWHVFCSALDALRATLYMC